MSLVQILAADRALTAGVDEAMRESARRSGEWLVCRPGCTPCCMGPFGITALDALRLREGLAALAPEAAERIRRRAEASIARIAPVYPGDVVTGELLDEDALPDELDEEPCPALDPASGRCDLYEARPVTCRTFGPPARTAENVYGACELCYEGVAEEAIAACAVDPDPAGVECDLLDQLAAADVKGMTIVAFALVRG